jgi:putative membrane protein
MLKPSALCAAVLALGLAAGASAQSTGGTRPGNQTTGTDTPTTTTKPSTKTNGALASGDKKFVEKAVGGSMLEVQLGQMAQQKASNEQVKQFGAKMAEDHAKAGDELKQIATAKGVQVPASVDKSHQKDVQKLEKLSGAQFDREYMKMMVADHKNDVGEFQKQAKSGKDAELKSFAAKTLPTLQEHMKMAQSTYDAVKAAK